MIITPFYFLSIFERSAPCVPKTAPKFPGNSNRMFFVAARYDLFCWLDMGYSRRNWMHRQRNVFGMSPNVICGSSNLRRARYITN
jgi:hypothetical protein